jgi:fibronectin-binding autotransporter adhesin
VIKPSSPVPFTSVFFREACKIALLATVTAALTFASRAQATTYTWANTALTNFTTPASWGSTAYPGAPPSGTTDLALFNVAEVSNPNLSVSDTIGEVEFSTAAASGYDITSSNTGIILALTGSTPVLSAITSGTNTIAAPITLQYTSGLDTIEQSVAGGTLMLSGQISGGSVSYGTHFEPVGVIEVTGTDNTYLGSTTITGNDPLEASAFSLGSTPGSLSTGAIYIGGSTLYAGGTNGGATLNYIGTGQTSDQQIFITTTTGSSTTNPDVISTVGATGPLVLTNNISGIIDNGTTSNATIVLFLVSADNFGDTISGSINTGANVHAVALEKQGVGNWTLSGANTFTGGVTVQQGTLNLNFSTVSSNVVSASNALALGAGTAGSDTLNLQGTSGSQSFTALTLSAGASHVDLSNSSGTMTLALGTLPTAITTGGTLDFGIPTADTVTTSATTTAANGLLSTAITINGTDFATISKGAIVADSANYVPNTSTAFTAGDIINMTAGNTTLSATSTTIAALRFNSPTSSTLNIGASHTLIIENGGVSSNEYGSAAILVTPNMGATTTDITGGALEGIGSGELELLQYNTAGTLEIDSSINNNSNTTALVKSGLGTALLTGTNNYTGATYVNEGTLEFQNEVSFYDNFNGSPTLDVAGNAIAAFAVGGTNQFTANNTTTSDLGFYLRYTGFQNGSYLGIDTTAEGPTGIYGDGAILANNGTNTIGLVKLGVGTLQLTNSNTYSGNTIIQVGTLALSSTSTNNIPNSSQILVGDTLAHNAATLDVTGISNLSGFQVQSGQTLGGYGKVIAGAVAVTTLSGSTISPGTNGAGGTPSSVGTLTITTSNLSLDQGTKFIYDLNGVGASDEVVVNGTLTLNNQQFTDFAFNLLSAPTAYTQYVLMSSTNAVAGNLGTDTTGTVDGYAASINISGDYLVLNIGQVPEPSTWTLLLGGVALLVLYQRRRWRRR